jgi:hypothetical protein
MDKEQRKYYLRLITVKSVVSTIVGSFICTCMIFLWLWLFPVMQDGARYLNGLVETARLAGEAMGTECAEVPDSDLLECKQRVRKRVWAERMK